MVAASGRQWRALAARTLPHRMPQPGMGIVVFIARQHGPDLACMFVGNSHQHYAERQSRSQLAAPQLLERRAFGCNRLGALPTAASALDQQCAQVTNAFPDDFTLPGTTADGMLGRVQTQPSNHL